ncbi:lysis protein [Rosenbergiella metrosideri]|uniref:lysis protein n=1 Tax=Rosenbergiella metrosideri TaxID=2921185 RepID=UPI001F4F5B95|nr:lysis protein [Rosenbergiella metrosideri]
MSNYQELVLYGLAVLCLVDRFILGRKKIDLIDIGEPQNTLGNAIAFPIKLKAKRTNITGAQVEYWLRDKRDPTTVISGKTRTLEFTEKGASSENLLIDTRYLDASDWALTVRIKHGNSRINPLYRVFPITKVLTKQFTITQQAGVFHATAS